MRAITTNWNNSAYALSASFVDKVTGNAVTVPALNPMNHRSMVDSVESGAYIYTPDSVAASTNALATEPEDENVVTVTVELDSVPVVGAPVRAVSADPAVVTVSPALAYTDDNGEVDFTLVSVADGVEDVTFSCGNVSDLTEVTVATP